MSIAVSRFERIENHKVKLCATPKTPPNSALIPREQSERPTSKTHSKKIRANSRNSWPKNKLCATPLTPPNSELITFELLRRGEAAERITNIVEQQKTKSSYAEATADVTYLSVAKIWA